MPDVARPGAVGPGGSVPLESAVWVDLEPPALLVAVTNGDGVPGPPLVRRIGSSVQRWVLLLQDTVAVVVREGLGLVGRGWGGQRRRGQSGESQGSKGDDGFDLHGCLLVFLGLEVGS